MAETTFVARRPEDLLALTPYLLGFHPERSVVMVTFGAGRPGFHARVDFPDRREDDAVVAGLLVDAAVANEVERCIVLLYTDDADGARDHGRCLLESLADVGVEVLDVIRFDGARFYAALEGDSCGTPYDLRSHEFTAERVLEGDVALRSRAELAQTLRAAADGEVDAVRRAAQAQVLGDVGEQSRWLGCRVREFVERGEPLSVRDAGRLVALVQQDPLHELAWTLMRREESEALVALWRDLHRRCPAELRAAVTSLLAFAAWLSGQGALAWCALECRGDLEGSDRAERLGDLVTTLMLQAVSPARWSQPDHSSPFGKSVTGL